MNSKKIGLYRFSPIKNISQLLEAIKHTHFSCHTLCKHTFGRYLPNAGNIGIFCHYEKEYNQLIQMRKKLTEPSSNPNQKYFKLYKPIIIKAKGDVPQTIYTHLYIRKPDIYRSQVGDVDFFLAPKEYLKIKKSLIEGANIKDGRIFPRQDLDMIELYHPDIDALAYVSTKMMTETVRVKQN
ncbi:MAG: hypothetical protein WC916_00815 [Candidatus Woesearchaeota archaeon]